MLVLLLCVSCSRPRVDAQGATAQVKGAVAARRKPSSACRCPNPQGLSFATTTVSGAVVIVVCLVVVVALRDTSAAAAVAVAAAVAAGQSAVAVTWS